MKFMKKLVMGVVFVGVMYSTAGFFVGPEGKDTIIIDEVKDIERPVKDERSFDEKATDALYDWKENPVGTESPFHREDESNPVYDGMLEEEKGKPKDSKSPFFVPETGNNVVEENLEKELEERKVSPGTSTFENPFE